MAIFSRGSFRNNNGADEEAMALNDDEEEKRFSPLWFTLPFQNLVFIYICILSANDDDGGGGGGIDDFCYDAVTRFLTCTLQQLTTVKGHTKKERNIITSVESLCLPSNNNNIQVHKSWCWEISSIKKIKYGHNAKRIGTVGIGKSCSTFMCVCVDVCSEYNTFPLLRDVLYVSKKSENTYWTLYFPHPNAIYTHTRNRNSWVSWIDIFTL